MNYLIGDRIAEAMIAAWELDGFDGKLNVVTVCMGVGTMLINAIIGIVKLFN
jgi:hypothetical protein